jgi:hypothetical protein
MDAYQTEGSTRLQPLLRTVADAIITIKKATSTER